MAREIEINGKAVKLETGKTPPPVTRGREKGPLRLLCEQMQDGESALLPLTPKQVQEANIYNFAKALNCKFTYRTEGEGVRIYRLPLDGETNVAPIKAASGW